MSYKIAICDDDSFYIDKIKDGLTQIMDSLKMELLFFPYSSGEELLEDVNQDFDIVYLDIDMKGMNGLETAAELRSKLGQVIIIFITSFIQYSPQGYEVNALRYILKDQRVFQQLLAESIEAATEQMRANRQERLFRFLGENKVVKLSHILYIESRVHHVIFHVVENKKIKMYQMRSKLDDVEKIIGDHRFCRIHKSYLVNMSYVDSCKRYEVNLRSGEVLHIAKSRYMDVLSHR